MTPATIRAMAPWIRPTRLLGMELVLYLAICAPVVGCGGGNPDRVGLDDNGTPDGGELDRDADGGADDGDDGQVPPVEGSAEACDLIAQTAAARARNAGGPASRWRRIQSASRLCS